MKVYNTFEYMKKIIGGVKVYGETNQDEESLKNLSEYEEIMRCIVYEISENLSYGNRNEDSIKKVHDKSLNVLKNMRDLISELIVDMGEE